jgi:hypothetical protein
MCSGEHGRGPALVKMGLRLNKAFTGVMRSPVRSGGFVPKGLNEGSQPRKSFGAGTGPIQNPSLIRARSDPNPCLIHLL